MSFQANLGLFAMLLRGDHNAAADRLKQSYPQPIDFIRFIERHWLQQLIATLLEGSPVRKLLPRQWLEDLKVSTLRQWVTQEGLFQELVALSPGLSQGGIEFILLKGPYHADRYFGGLDCRAFSDLDLLVKKESLAEATKVLRGNGYVQMSSTLLGWRLTSYFTHSFDYLKPEAAVDLHWRFSAQPALRLDYDAIWREKRIYVLRDHPFYVLSDEYELVFNLLSIFKDIEMGMARLRGFVDLYFILKEVRHQLDWSLFLQNRGRDGTRGAVLTVLALLLGLFDCAETFTEARAMLDLEPGSVKVVPAENYQPLLEGVAGATWNKIWASGVYESSRLSVLSWWLVGLPFRIAVHHPDKFARVKRVLEPLKLSSSSTA